MMAKTASFGRPHCTLDQLLAAILIVVSAPLMVAITVALLVQRQGSVLYRQQRAGLRGRNLTLHKFRTLVPDAPEDLVIAAGDRHITPVGRLLRSMRLDELPQLFDVLRGELALVGPRPERFDDLSEVEPALLDQYLAIQPGLTGEVQLAYIAEDDLLATVPDPTSVYRSRLIPAKVAANLACYRVRSVRADLRCLLRTVSVLLSRRARERSRTLIQQVLEPPVS